MRSARAMLSGESSAVGNAQETSTGPPPSPVKAKPSGRGGPVSRSAQVERLCDRAEGGHHRVVVAQELDAHVVGARGEVLVEPGRDGGGVALRDERVDEP